MNTSYDHKGRMFLCPDEYLDNLSRSVDEWREQSPYDDTELPGVVPLSVAEAYDAYIDAEWSGRDTGTVERLRNAWLQKLAMAADGELFEVSF